MVDIVTKKVLIIGGGVGGLASAILMAKQGHQVILYEKNNKLGGRINILEAGGFRRDMGPSWYLMPDVFEKFFQAIGEDIHQHLTLEKLSPAYRIFYKDISPKDLARVGSLGDEDRIDRESDGFSQIAGNIVVDIYGDIERDIETLSQLEVGVADHFRKYISTSREQYDLVMHDFVYKNIDKRSDLLGWKMAWYSLKLNIFGKFESYISKFFRTDMVRKLISYPLLFLGISPSDAPAILNIISHLDFHMGVFYPKGGMYKIVQALHDLGLKYGVQYHTDMGVSHIEVDNHNASITGVVLSDGTKVDADIIINNADMQYVETKLLDKQRQTYTNEYRYDKTIAPSAYMMYLGIDGHIDTLKHHNIIFCQDWETNRTEIFGDPKLPHDPSIYICKSSDVDPSMAPLGQTSLSILVPIAPEPQRKSIDEYMSVEQLEHFQKNILKIIAQVCDIYDLETRIVQKHIFTLQDFKVCYNSYRGTALGLANTIGQSALLRPSNQSAKVKNLYYVGSYTNPGIGVPSCLVSAQLVADKIQKSN